MIWYQKSIWDVAADLGGPAAGIIVGAAGLAFLQKYFRNGNGNGNGKKSGCLLHDADINELRSRQIAETVSRDLGPKLDQQTRLLSDIRDGVRDLKL